MLARDLLQGRLGCVRPPSPGVAEPQGWQNVNRCWIGPTITHTDLDENVLWSLLGILDEDIEVAVAVENARIQQLVFHLAAVPPFAGSNQVFVREGGLGILVQV